MTSKFSAMNEAFSQLYGRGATFEEICDKLGISIPTAQIWRKRLGLQPRSGQRGPISWMDERRIRGKSYREILQQIAGPIGLTSKDIEFILSRFDKLRSKGKTRGRPHLHLILAAAYLYLRWEGSGREPKSPKSFMFVCKTSGFKISRSALLMSSRLFNEAGLYPQVRLTPQQLLDRLWKSLAAEYKLPESTRTAALHRMSNAQLIGRTPEAVVAACVYLAALECGAWVGQRALADEFGVTEVSLRNVAKLIESSCSTIQKTNVSDAPPLPSPEMAESQESSENEMDQ